MKRGKDDEKIMGPMFPRLHVNDTDKGGPRPPPRNKMALYEQLSIPSQRFNSGRLPLNPNNTSNLVPLSSSSLGSGHERGIAFPLHLPPSTPIHMAENLRIPQSDTVNLSTPLTQHQQGKKAGDEDDFTVPIFIHSEMSQCHSENQHNSDREKLTPFGPTYSGHLLNVQNASDKDPKQTSSTVPKLGPEVRRQSDVHPNECVLSRDHSVKPSTNLLTRKMIDSPVKQSIPSSNRDYSDNLVAKFVRSHDSDTCLQQEYRASSWPEDAEHCAGDLHEPTRDIEKGNASRQRSGSLLRDGHRSPNERDIDSEYLGDRTCGSLKTGNVDRGDDASEISMVDSISCLDISPDDVVGIIGQKHFWKARRLIVNQQRVFAVQVFELHRLIKVQRLIAGSPDLLLEDSAYLGNASSKGTPAKKLPSEYVVKSSPLIVKHKDDSEKPNYKMECSAENAVGRTSLSSVKNGSQPSNYGPYLGNPPPAPVAADAKMGPWCFHQPPGHQWLVPIMSPSEGLIYKPYPGPGFMGTICGGCGPLGPTPLTGSFMNHAYGVPASHNHHQGIGALPGAPSVGHGYFPPYGMPVISPAISGSAVEQMNQFAGPGSHGQPGQLSGGGANFNMQHQSSCKLPSQKSAAISQAVKFSASKGSETQGSTASSPGERVQRVEISHIAEGRDALSLFPVAPVVSEGVSQPHDTDQPTRVIKVVPHNPRSATESAARIFQSIQEERKQYDSI